MERKKTVGRMQDDGGVKELKYPLMGVGIDKNKQFQQLPENVILPIR